MMNTHNNGLTNHVSNLILLIEDDIDHAELIIVPLTTYPLIYYLVPYMPRYRVPIDWMLFVLAGADI